MKKIIVGKIVGRTGLSGWGQVYDFTPDDDTLRSTRGRLVVVIGIGQAGLEGREMLLKIHDTYYLSEEPVFEALKKAVGECGGASVAACVVVGENIYLVTRDGAMVWASVAGKDGFALKSDGALVGKMVDGEVIVLGNKRFWSSVPVGIIRAVTSDGVDAACETLATVEQGKAREEGEAGVIIKFTEETEAKKAIKPREKPVFLDNVTRSDSRKKWVYVGWGFLGILLLLVMVGRMKTKKVEEAKSERGVLIEKIVTNFKNAEGVVAVDRETGRSQLKVVEQDLEKLDQIALKDKRIVEIKAKMGEVLGAATGKVDIQLDELVDLTLVRKDVVGSEMGILGSKIYVLDVPAARILEVDTKSGKSAVVIGKNAVGDVEKMALYPGKIVTWSKDKGLVECENEKYTCKTKFGPGDVGFDVFDMAMFSANIYGLDKKENKIWKFGLNKQDWLAKTESPDFSNALGMVINGDVWVTVRKGEGVEILKFNRGVRQGFEISGLDKLFGNDVVTYADADTEKMYFLDKINSRIVVTSTGGKFDRQLVESRLVKMVGVVADEKNGKIYLLGEGKVWVGAL